MTGPPIVSRPPYRKRDVPRGYDHGWWVVELGNLQRAIPTFAQRTINTFYTPTAVDRTILCDCTLSAVVIGLPAANRQKGLELIIKKVAGGFPVTIFGTVDGVVDPTLPNLYDCMTVQSDGTQWLKISQLP